MENDDLPEDYGHGDSDHDTDGHHHDGHPEVDGHHHRDAGVVQIGRKKYAWGLTWEFPHEIKTRRGLVREAMSFAREHDFDLFCPLNTHLYGLGYADAGHRRGMLSLAGCIQSSETDISSNCILAFPMGDDAVYLIAIDENGLINPQTDTLLPDSVARQAFSDLQNSGIWRTLRSPDRWEIAGSTEAKLSDFLAAPSGACKLKSAQTNETLILAAKIMGVTVGVIGLWYAWSSWSDYKAEQARIEAAKKSAKSAAAARQAAIAAALREAWPYDRALRGEVSISRCQALMGITPTILPDYTMTSMQCVPGSGLVRVNFMATSPMATLVHVPEYVAAMTSMKPHIIDGKNSVVLVYDYKKAFQATPETSYPVHDKFLPLKDVKRYLADSFDAAHLSPNLTLQQETPPHSPPRQMIAGKPVAAPPVDAMVFKVLHVGIQTSYTPDDFIQILAPLRAWTVSLIEYSEASRTWRINANVYEGVMQSVVDKGLRDQEMPRQ